MSYILEAVELAKDFGSHVAVSGVNLQVRRGELRSIIGPNGAGKTTLFNLLSGHIPPSKGRILYKGADITDAPVHDRSHLGISRSFQLTNIFPRLSAFENVRIAAQSRKVTWEFWKNGGMRPDVNAKAQELVNLVNLREVGDAMAGTLSYGQQRYLEIAISLATEPELLLLDEPTAGMSPEESLHTASFIKGLSGAMTILLVEHDMEVVMGISDSVTVLHNGAVLAEGSPEEIRRNKIVQQVYLREGTC